MTTNVPIEIITNKIYFIRNIKVMLDRDLAGLYGVETKALKQAVKRNIVRFPEDFMFELTKHEFDHLRSQIVTSSGGGKLEIINYKIQSGHTSFFYVINI